MLWQPPSSGGPGRPPKPIAQLNPDFANEWQFSLDPPLVCHRDKPHHLMKYEIFDNTIRPFAHHGVKNVSNLLLEHESAKNDKVSYSPNRPSGSIQVGDLKAINAYVPIFIEQKKGNVTIWKELLEYLFPNERDRKEIGIRLYDGL